ncbi:MAG: hypothetical protein JO329_06760 [Planctomycetaceae bacterium]|nr:hypothetical protein [Planctomycetaceae bacterium]
MIRIVLRLEAAIVVTDKAAASVMPLGPEHRGTPERRSHRAGAQSPDPAVGRFEPGKMAAYAVRALALHGSDAALAAIVALAIRYLTKNKNMSKAAIEAAKLLGITPTSWATASSPDSGSSRTRPASATMAGDGSRPAAARTSSSRSSTGQVLRPPG